ncbi:MAG: VOC family protein, partial [Ilumatobacteraceae bacterium]
MPVSFRIRHITIDCRDPFALAEFWKAVLGFVDEPGEPNEPGDDEALIVDPQARHPGVLFIAVPEPKSVKNRIHLDLVPAMARDVAVQDVLALGATLVADHRLPDGGGWVVVADPEGNELCIERSDVERGRPEPATVDDVDYPNGTATADELEMLTAVLDWYRAAVLRKVADLDPVVARTSPVRS